MRKAGLILLLGVVVATAAFTGLYYLGTAPSRALINEPQPELAWLKKEFKLSEAEFERISKLHEAYLPQCVLRCQRIAEQNQQLQQLLKQSSSVTPEIHALLTARAQMRADCEAEMLKHFLEVSGTMPPDQGRRYLEWVEQHTVFDTEPMEHHHHSLAPSSPMADHR